MSEPKTFVRDDGREEAAFLDDRVQLTSRGLYTSHIDVFCSDGIVSFDAGGGEYGFEFNREETAFFLKWLKARLEK